MATMTVVPAVTVCHGNAAFIPKESNGRSYPDYIAFAVMLLCYILYSIQFIVRIYLNVSLYMKNCRFNNIMAKVDQLCKVYNARCIFSSKLWLG